MSSSENAYFKRSDTCISELAGFTLPNDWWSRVYEYPWALQYAGKGLTVADMGCGWEYRPFKDALAQICTKVYAVDQHWELNKQPKIDNVEFVVADFTRHIDAIPDESLDRIFCISVLEDITHRLTEGLTEFYRCLKPGGLCVITCDVQYDIDRPLAQFPAVNIYKLDRISDLVGFQIREAPNMDLDDAVYHWGWNLCVYHYVMEKV